MKTGMVDQVTETESLWGRVIRLEQQMHETDRKVSDHDDRLEKNEQLVGLLNSYWSENAIDDSAPL